MTEQESKIDCLAVLAVEAVEEANLKLTCGIGTILRDIVENCTYTTSRSQIEEYRKRIVESAQKKKRRRRR